MIRSAAKAIVIHNGKILLNRYVFNSGEYYELPGGGQIQYEALEDTVAREVLEETGYEVVCGKFVAVAEEINDNAEIRSKYPDYAHRILHIFLAELKNTLRKDASETDFHQEESLWATPDEADSLNIRPASLHGRLSELISGGCPQYLGCVHVS